VSPRRKRRRTWPVLLLLLGAAVAVAYLFLRPPELKAAPLANVPPNASAVLHLDVAALRDGTLWRRLVVGRGADRGLRRLEERCGFDPVDDLETVTVFVSGDEPFALDHVAAVIAGPIQHERLGECLGDAAEETGAKLKRTEVEGLPAIAGERGDSRAVFVGRRGIVFGPEPTVVRTIQTIRDGVGSANDGALGLIFRDVEGRDLTFAARIPPQWREQAERYVDSRAMAILAKLDAIAVGARLRRGLSASIRLVMEDNGAATELAETIEDTIARILDAPMVGFTPLSGALRQVEVTAEGTMVLVAFDWSEDRVGRLLDLAGEVEDRPGGISAAIEGLLRGDEPAPE
jgi:hypothetical protein